MRSHILSLIYPLTRILLAFRVAMLLLAPAMVAQAAGGDWQQFSASPVGSQPITALISDRSGNVWAGTEERGLARWDGGEWTAYTIADGLPDMRVVALFEDSGGRLWVATGNGLGYFPADRSAFRRIGAAGAPALPVTAFEEDSEGRIWLGTPRGPAAWREDGAFEIAQGLAGRRIVSLARARDGEIWAATSEGLWRSSAEGWRPAEGGAPGAISQLKSDQNGGLYALAGGKVWRLDAGGWIGEPAPFDQGVTAFAIDGERVWAARSGRVFAAEGGITHGYEGAIPNVTNVGEIVVAKDGAVWFGTRTGLGAYRPATDPPKIAAVRVNGAQAGAEAVTLARNRIQALNVTVDESRGGAAQATALFAQLDGIDATPRTINGELAGTYRDAPLAPGEHTLRVWAVDGDFNRSEDRLVTLVVPDLTYLPLGVALPTEVVGPLLAVFSTAAGVALTAILIVALAKRAKRRAAAREAARVRAVLSMAGNPYEGGLAFDPALRAEQAQDVLAALTGPATRSVLLLGARGMGKTTLLRQLADGAANAGAANAGVAKLHPAYLDLAQTREEEFFARAMSELYEALTPRMIGERPRLEAHARGGMGYGEREFAADTARLFAFLSPAASEPLRAALLLDNADVLDGYPGATREAVRRLVVATGGPLRLVLAAEKPPACLEGLTEQLALVHLPPLPAPSLERLLLAPAKGAYEWEPDATRGAVALSQGRPGKLREVAEKAVGNARRNGRVRIAGTDVTPIRATP
jgi:hypothetical protein